MALNIVDAEEFENNAPQPLDAESFERGSFQRLGEGQGVVTAQRANHTLRGNGSWRDDLPVSGRTLTLVVVAALAAIVVIVALVIGVLNAPGPAPASAPVVEQLAVASDETITYRGSIYALELEDDTYQLVETREDGTGHKVSLGELAGKPAGLVLYDGALVVPESLDDGTWDVLAYTIGSGWSQIMDQEGNSQGGRGSVTDVSLEGSTLRIVADGVVTDVMLAW